MGSLFGAFSVLVGSFLSIFGVIKYFIISNFKLEINVSKLLLKDIKTKSRFLFVLDESFGKSDDLFEVFVSFCRLENFFLMFDKKNVMLTAGQEPKENMTTIYFLRWEKVKVVDYLTNLTMIENEISCNALTKYSTVRLGKLKTLTNDIYLEENQYKDIEDDVKDMLDNNKNKTGAILYGEPGNGKTSLIRYLAIKFNLSIYQIYLTPEYTNLEISYIFSKIPKRCIVLFEDFDNYFNKRECLFKNSGVKFTFDSLLNSLDGVHNDYEQVVFLMTANDINKIDDSLKNRSSRFKFLREIKPPSYQKRLEILKNESLATLTEGLSLDKVFFVDSLKDKYNETELLEKVNYQKN
jgi:hypothetical protein